MDLSSYLLKPVQRMSKYALLLTDLMKEVGVAQEAELAVLQAATNMVKFQLRHGNDLLAMDAIRDCDVSFFSNISDYSRNVGSVRSQQSSKGSCMEDEVGQIPVLLHLCYHFRLLVKTSNNAPLLEHFNCGLSAQPEAALDRMLHFLPVCLEEKHSDSHCQAAVSCLFLNTIHIFLL